MLTLERCGVILFPLNYLFAIRITGKSQQHFDCCSVILKFNVEESQHNKINQISEFLLKNSNTTEIYSVITNRNGTS